MLGILLINKPHGLTSHDVVNDVRRKFQTRRVGHAGTLDPLATGLLVVAVGPATRFLQYLPLEPKVYVADVKFGAETNTYDAEGEPIQQRPVPEDLPAAIEAAMPQFLGLIQQIPPLYSAIKVKGKPLYKYARAGGEEPKREPRTVHIGEYRLLDHDADSARFQITCSGGTYVRSLAHDLGRAMGCGAFLQGLIRSGVGRFELAQGNDLREIHPSQLLPLREALAPMPMVLLDANQVRSVREGRVIQADVPEGVQIVGLLTPDGDVFSVARVRGNLLQPECVIPAEVTSDVV